jgi:hypothetical protein
VDTELNLDELSDQNHFTLKVTLHERTSLLHDLVGIDAESIREESLYPPLHASRSMRLDWAR